MRKLHNNIMSKESYQDALLDLIKIIILNTTQKIHHHRGLMAGPPASCVQPLETAEGPQNVKTKGPKGPYKMLAHFQYRCIKDTCIITLVLKKTNQTILGPSIFSYMGS